MRFIIFCLFASLLTNCDFFTKKSFYKSQNFKFCSTSTIHQKDLAIKSAEKNAKHELYNLTLAKLIYEYKNILNSPLKINTLEDDIQLKYKTLNDRCIKIDQKLMINFYQSELKSKNNSIQKILENIESVDLISRDQIYSNTQNTVKDMLFEKNLLNTLGFEVKEINIYNIHKRLEIQKRSNLNNINVDIESDDINFEKAFREFFSRQGIQLKKASNILIKINIQKTTEHIKNKHTCKYSGVINAIDIYKNTITHSKMIDFESAGQSVEQACKTAFNEYKKKLKDLSFNDLFN